MGWDSTVSADHLRSASQSLRGLIWQVDGCPFIAPGSTSMAVRLSFCCGLLGALERAQQSYLRRPPFSQFLLRCESHEQRGTVGDSFHEAGLSPTLVGSVMLGGSGLVFLFMYFQLVALFFTLGGVHYSFRSSSWDLLFLYSDRARGFLLTFPVGGLLSPATRWLGVSWFLPTFGAAVSKVDILTTCVAWTKSLDGPDGWSSGKQWILGLLHRRGWYLWLHTVTLLQGSLSPSSRLVPADPSWMGSTLLG